MTKTAVRFREALTVVFLLVLLFSGSVLSAAETLAPPAAEMPASHAELTQQQAAQTHAEAAAQGINIGHGEASAPGMFDVDPWILISQTINFFLLLFLLKRFLFLPISNIIEERRRNLGRVKMLAEAEHNKALALKQEYEQCLEKIDQEIYEIRQKAILDTSHKVEEIIKDARKRAEEIIEHGEMEIFMERQTAWARLREEVVHLTLMAAEKVVEESLDDDLHRKLIKKTIERLETDLPDYESQ